MPQLGVSVSGVFSLGANYADDLAATEEEVAATVSQWAGGGEHGQICIYG